MDADDSDDIPGRPAGATDTADAGSARSRRRVVGLAAAVTIVVGAAVAVGTVRSGDEPAPAPAPTTPMAIRSPSPTPHATPPAAIPPPVDATALAALPLAFYDAVIPALLDGTTTTPENQWKIATPRQALVPLYAGTAADAAPIAALGATVPTVGTPTATAVWGVFPGADGGMVLVSTPARNATPGDGGTAEAPSATFAWARAADLTIAPVDRMVQVDNATSAVTIVDPAGSVVANETARLGTPQDPTPAATATYMEANYVDTRIAYTQGHPIALTGAHSALLPGYGGNSALTALHFYPDPTGSSHGCVRVSAAMTEALATLPVGTPILFT